MTLNFRPGHGVSTAVQVLNYNSSSPGSAIGVLLCVVAWVVLNDGVIFYVNEAIPVLFQIRNGL